MTAVSLLVQQHAAFLVTDAAYYDAQGVMVAVQSKVARAPQFRMAIGCSGCVRAKQIVDALGSQPDQSAALAALPLLARTVRAGNRSNNPGGEASRYNEFMLFAAIWSDRSDRAEGWVLASDQSYLGATYSPFTLVEVEQLTSPPLGTLALTAIDVVANAAGILERQRSYRWADDDPHRYVGGYGEATFVGQYQMATVEVCRWPDRVGERIAT